MGQRGYTLVLLGRPLKLIFQRLQDGSLILARGVLQVAPGALLELDHTGRNWVKIVVNSDLDRLQAECSLLASFPVLIFCDLESPQRAVRDNLYSHVHPSM